MTKQSYTRGVFDTVARMGLGAIVLGRQGHVSELSDEAKKHIGVSIRLVHGQLAAIDRNANEQFQALICNAAASQQTGQVGDESFVILPQPSGRPVIAYAAPLGAGPDDTDTGVIVLLINPDDRREPNATLLRKLFALTPAELRLAVALARGRDLQSIAEIFSVSPGTLRVHLKAVFQKTGTSRQAELVCLLASLSTPMI